MPRYRRRAAASTPPKTERFSTPALPSVVREADPDSRYGDARLVADTDVATLLRWGRDPVAHAKNKRQFASLCGLAISKPEWFGADDADAVRSLRDWPEGRRLAAAHRRDLPEVRLPVARRVRRWSGDGDEFCRDRFDAGLDECWATRRRESLPGRGGTLRLTVQIGGSSGTRAADLAWTGAAALAVVDAAEAAGLQLAVDAISSACEAFPGIRDTTHIRVAAKRAGEPVDPSALALAVACPAFFRWHVIGARHCLPWKIDDGSGRTMSTPSDLRGDLHLRQVRDRRDAADEVARLARDLERIAAGSAGSAALAA